MPVFKQYKKSDEDTVHIPMLQKSVLIDPQARAADFPAKSFSSIIKRSRVAVSYFTEQLPFVDASLEPELDQDVLLLDPDSDASTEQAEGGLMGAELGSDTAGLVSVQVSEDEKNEILARVEQEARDQAQKSAEEWAQTQAKEWAESYYQEQKQQMDEDLHKQQQLALEQLEKDSDQQRDQAYQEGLQKGEAKGRAHFDEQAEAFMGHINALSQTKVELLQEMGRGAIDLAMVIAQKVIQTEIESNDDVFFNILKEAISTVTDKDRVIVKVNESDLDVVETFQDQFKKALKDIKKLDIVADPSISQGGCVVETNMGYIDSSISTKLQLIQEALQQDYIDQKNEAAALDEVPLLSASEPESDSASQSLPTEEAPLKHEDEDEDEVFAPLSTEPLPDSGDLDTFDEIDEFDDVDTSTEVDADDDDDFFELNEDDELFDEDAFEDI